MRNKRELTMTRKRGLVPMRMWNHLVDTVFAARVVGVIGGQLRQTTEGTVIDVRRRRGGGSAQGFTHFRVAAVKNEDTEVWEAFVGKGLLLGMDLQNPPSPFNKSITHDGQNINLASAIEVPFSDGVQDLIDGEHGLTLTNGQTNWVRLKVTLRTEVVNQSLVYSFGTPPNGTAILAERPTAAETEADTSTAYKGAGSLTSSWHGTRFAYFPLAGIKIDAEGETATVQQVSRDPIYLQNMTRGRGLDISLETQPDGDLADASP